MNQSAPKKTKGKTERVEKCLMDSGEVSAGVRVIVFLATTDCMCGHLTRFFDRTRHACRHRGKGSRAGCKVPRSGGDAPVLQLKYSMLDVGS